ncbi:hypothetical protein PN36_14255 [Candidatus Thiomargarita nelsonii]|uniref:Uncharacterized protein n=1 Tax=Candidatus Thiomargarita nelsonii TaxID=1003181 RepID=A0A4E0R271_9GAMM|nr:hypothetical protein PN36_14255 [Candidatus Thiomargarita nelsonii]
MSRKPESTGMSRRQVLGYTVVTGVTLTAWAVEYLLPPKPIPDRRPEPTPKIDSLHIVRVMGQCH